MRVRKQECLQLCNFSCVSSTCGSEMEVKVDFIVRSGRKCYNLVVWTATAHSVPVNCSWILGSSVLILRILVWVIG